MVSVAKKAICEVRCAQLLCNAKFCIRFECICTVALQISKLTSAVSLSSSFLSLLIVAS